MTFLMIFDTYTSIRRPDLGRIDVHLNERRAMKKEELEVGKYVWWTANRYMTAWSCPCIVTFVGKDGYRVQSFDDFKETDLLAYRENVPEGHDPSSLLEMRVCDKEEVRTYIRRKEEDLIAKKRVHQDAIRALSLRQKQLKTMFQSILS